MNSNRKRTIIASSLYIVGIPFMPTLIMQKNTPQPRFWIWVTMIFLIGILITVLRDEECTIQNIQAN